MYSIAEQLITKSMQNTGILSSVDNVGLSEVDFKKIVFKNVRGTA